MAVTSGLEVDDGGEKGQRSERSDREVKGCKTSCEEKSGGRERWGDVRSVVLCSVKSDKGTWIKSV
jgi:hypothetical protein